MNLQNSPLIFIIGVSHRTGTAYLNSLLTKHPLCGVSRIPGEDYLLYSSELITNYVSNVVSMWNTLASEQSLGGEFLPAIGRGLAEFITPEINRGKRIISRAPLPYGAVNHSKLFPGAKVILIIRNGQDLTESHLRSFNYRFEYVVRKWIKGMREIERIRDSSAAGLIHVIKYEELYTDTKAQMKAILNFLNLDQDVYDFEAAVNTEVIGSSDVKIRTGNLHWNPVPRYEEFKPLERSASWSKWRHYRFNYLAGDISRSHGYALKHDKKNFEYYCYNFLVSFGYYLHLYPNKFINAIRAYRKGIIGMVEAYRKEF